MNKAATNSGKADAGCRLQVGRRYFFESGDKALHNIANGNFNVVCEYDAYTMITAYSSLRKLFDAATEYHECNEGLAAFSAVFEGARRVTSADVAARAFSEFEGCAYVIDTATGTSWTMFGPEFHWPANAAALSKHEELTEDLHEDDQYWLIFFSQFECHVRKRKPATWERWAKWQEAS